MASLIINKTFDLFAWDGDVEGYESGVYKCSPEEGRAMWEAVQAGERIKFLTPPGKRVKGRSWFPIWKDWYCRVAQPNEEEWQAARKELRHEFATTDAEGYEAVAYERYWVGSTIDGEEIVCRETVYP